VLQEIVAARVDAQAGRGERPGRVEIHHAGDRRDPLAQRGGRLLEARQLQPAQPDDQLGAGAAEQLLDAFVQELLDVEGEAGHAAGLLPERLGHRLRIDVGCELHHYLAALGAPDVLREGRAADHLRHRAHAGDGEEAPAHLGAHPDRLREAHPRRTGHVHHEVRLVELGQELEVRERAQADGHRDGREAAGEDGRRAGEHAGERPLVPAAERRHEPWRLRMARDSTREQHERQRRRHRERDAERGERRQHVGERQRAEQRALETAEQEDGQEDEGHHDRRVDDGAAHLHRGGEHDVERAGTGGRAAQPPPGVLDVDDRVVHHLPDGDREAAEHHDVEGRARRTQHGHGREQRERDGDHAHHRRPQLGREDQEHERHQDGAGQERAAQVAKGVRHEARLAEHRPLDAHVGGQRAHDRLERVLDRRGDGQHVLLGLLGDEQHDAALAVHDRVAHGDRRPLPHVGDGGERHGHVIPARERRPREIAGAVQPAVEPGGQPLPAAVEEPRAAGRVRRGSGGGEVVERRAGRQQPLRGGRHLYLADAAAVDHHVGDPRHGQQPRADGPFGQVAQDERRRAAHADRQDRRQRRGERRDRWARARRQLLGGEREPFDHDLARPVGIGPVGVDGGQHGEARDRRRAQRRQLGRAAERALERPGDEGLHVLGREPRRLHLDLDDRRGELGKDVEGGMTRRVEAAHQKRRGEEEDDFAVTERRADESAHHGLRART